MWEIYIAPQDVLISLCSTSHNNLLLPPLRMYRLDRQLTTVPPARVAEHFSKLEPAGSYRITIRH